MSTCAAIGLSERQRDALTKAMLSPGEVVCRQDLPTISKIFAQPEPPGSEVIYPGLTVRSGGFTAAARISRLDGRLWFQAYMRDEKDRGAWRNLHELNYFTAKYTIACGGLTYHGYWMYRQSPAWWNVSQFIKDRLKG